MWLERFTAGVLVVVIILLGWMVLAEDLPAWLRFAQIETEVLIVVFFLCLALGLVSGLALLHTRSGPNSKP